MSASDGKLLLYVIVIALVIVIIYKLATPAAGAEGIARIPYQQKTNEGYSASMVSPLVRSAQVGYDVSNDLGRSLGGIRTRTLQSKHTNVTSGYDKGPLIGGIPSSVLR